MQWQKILSAFGIFSGSSTYSPKESDILPFPLPLTYDQVFQFALDHLPHPNRTMKRSKFPRGGKVPVPEMTRAEYFARMPVVSRVPINEFIVEIDTSGLVLRELLWETVAEEERERIAAAGPPKEIVERERQVELDLGVTSEVFEHQLVWLLKLWHNPKLYEIVPPEELEGHLESRHAVKGQEPYLYKAPPYTRARVD